MSNFLNDYNPLVCTDAEIALLRDQEIWKTKKKLTTKIDNLLGQIEAEARHRYTDCFENLSGLKWRSKLSRGEQYEGYPYRILDAPGHFHHNHLSAVRNFIWFGHYACSYLLLKGTSALGVQISICTDATPWNHRFEENMISLDQGISLISNHEFIKLGLKAELGSLEEMHLFFTESYRIYTELIA
jgi:hypothetical protein